MISTQEIRDKEIINILDGKSLGYVSDIEINLERGRVEALIVPSQRGLFGMFSGADEYIIKWKDIKKIGEDVILAEVREASAFDDLHGNSRSDRYKDYRGRTRYYDDELDEEDAIQKREQKQEKEGFFKARTKNPDSPDESSEIRIRLKNEDDTKIDDYE